MTDSTIQDSACHACNGARFGPRGVCIKCQGAGPVKRPCEEHHKAMAASRQVLEASMVGVHAWTDEAERVDMIGGHCPGCGSTFYVNLSGDALEPPECYELSSSLSRAQQAFLLATQAEVVRKSALSRVEAKLEALQAFKLHLLQQPDDERTQRTLAAVEAEILVQESRHRHLRNAYGQAF